MFLLTSHLNKPTMGSSCTLYFMEEIFTWVKLGGRGRGWIYCVRVLARSMWFQIIWNGLYLSDQNCNCTAITSQIVFGYWDKKCWLNVYHGNYTHYVYVDLIWVTYLEAHYGFYIETLKKNQTNKYLFVSMILVIYRSYCSVYLTLSASCS